MVAAFASVLVVSVVSQPSVITEGLKQNQEGLKDLPETVQIRGKVVGVIAGDTIDVLVDDEAIRERLNGIDAPERGQPFENNAKDFVSKRLRENPSVRVIDLGDHRYGRMNGDVYVDGSRLGVMLVESGLAWHYVRVRVG